MDAGEREQIDRMAVDVHETMTRRDINSFLRWVSPDVDFVPLLAGVEGGGAWSGHDGVRRWLDGLFEAWEGYDPKFQLAEKVAEQTYVFAVNVALRGRESGLLIDRVAFQAIEFDEEWRATWWRFFDEFDDAVDAAGERSRTEVSR